MRLVAADLKLTRTTLSNLQSLAKDPEALGGALRTWDRLRLQELPNLLRRLRRRQPAPKPNKSPRNPLPAANLARTLRPAFLSARFR
jgi:hypothetical protein